MRTLIIALTMLGFLFPAVACADDWEEFQKQKARAERPEMISKGPLKLLNKDFIIEEIRKECEITFTSDAILFHYGTPQIKAESQPNLEIIASALNEALNDPELSKIETYFVDGHTCTIGSFEMNCRLSWERAAAVVNALISYGVPEERLSPRGFSYSDPAHPNDTEANRRLNRRVVVKGDCPGIDNAGAPVCTQTSGLSQGGSAGSQGEGYPDVEYSESDFGEPMGSKAGGPPPKRLPPGFSRNPGADKPAKMHK